MNNSYYVYIWIWFRFKNIYIGCKQKKINIIATIINVIILLMWLFNESTMQT